MAIDAFKLFAIINEQQGKIEFANAYRIHMKTFYYTPGTALK